MEISGDLGLTENELIQALQEALDRPEQSGGGMTVSELAQVCGWNVQTVRHRLQHLKAAGRLESIRLQRECLDGVVRRMPAYRLIESQG